MKITRFNDAPKYDAAKHFDVYAMHLQDKNLSSGAPFWVGFSHYLPGGKAEWDGSPFHKVYVVLEGEITVATEEGEQVLRQLDSCYLAPNERRQVRNDTNHIAKLLYAITYPTE